MTAKSDSIHSRDDSATRDSLSRLAVCYVAAAIIGLLEIFRLRGLSYAWLFFVPGMYAAWTLRDRTAWTYWSAVVALATCIKFWNGFMEGFFLWGMLEHSVGVALSTLIVYLVWDRRHVTNSLSHVNQRFRRRLARRTFHLRQASHKFHQLVLESLPDAVLVNANGRVAFCNEAFARLVGAPSPTSLLGVPAARFVPSDRWAAIGQVPATDMDVAKEPLVEEKIITLSGDPIPVNVSATAIRYRGLPSTLLVLYDLRQRKAAEEAQRNNEEHLRLAMATAPIGTWEWNARTGEVVWSESLWKMFGLRPYSEPLHFGTFLREIHEDDRRKVQRGFRRAIEEDAPYYVELRFVRPDGSLRWALEHGQILRDADGNVARMVGITVDITESKKLAKEILLVSEFREAVISRAAEGICVCHPVPDFPYLRFSVWNERMRGITGYTLEEMNRLGWFHTVFPDPMLRERAIERMRRMGEGDELREEEWTITTKEGRERVVEVSTSALSQGAESGSVVALFHDLTDRKRAEELLAVQRAELLHCSRLSTLGQMASTLSHEIAQPLNAIANFAGAGIAILNRADLSEQERLRSYLREIMDQSQRTNAILRQMCRYGRRSPSTQFSCDLNSVARDSLRLLSLELRRQDIHVEAILTDDELSTHIERVQLEQVIVNLLTNAMEAIGGSNSEDRRILLKTYTRRAWGILEVEDFGPGVSASIRERLFEAFISSKEQGSGIGLSICKDIIERQGGKIQYVEPGHAGAMFQVHVPLASANLVAGNTLEVLHDY